MQAGDELAQFIIKNLNRNSNFIFVWQYEILYFCNEQTKTASICFFFISFWWINKYKPAYTVICMQNVTSKKIITTYSIDKQYVMGNDVASVYALHMAHKFEIFENKMNKFMDCINTDVLYYSMHIRTNIYTQIFRLCGWLSMNSNANKPWLNTKNSSIFGIVIYFFAFISLFCIVWVELCRLEFILHNSQQAKTTWLIMAWLPHSARFVALCFYSSKCRKRIWILPIGDQPFDWNP